MSPYWIHSYKLAQKYAYMAVCINAHMYMKTNPFLILWNDERFTSVFPFTDYMYQPSYFEGFIQTYYTYKQSQLNEDNISGMKSQ